MAISADVNVVESGMDVGSRASTEVCNRAGSICIFL